MRRITGIGGIFIRAKNPESLGKRYRTHLGIDVQSWGGATFSWKDDRLPGEGMTVWTLFKPDSTHFPGPFMVNYPVEM